MPSLQKYRDDIDRIQEAKFSAWRSLGKTRKPHPEEERRHCAMAYHHEFAQAENELRSAIHCAELHKLESFRAGRRVPDQRAVHRLLNDADAKRQIADRFAAAGAELVRSSAIIETRVRADIARAYYSAALDLNGAKNINECRRPKRRAVIHGFAADYVRTGKFRLVDGERVPVLERIK
jgi:hypothetical protein